MLSVISDTIGISTFICTFLVRRPLWHYSWLYSEFQHSDDIRWGCWVTFRGIFPSYFLLNPLQTFFSSYICLFDLVFRHTREFFTYGDVTSPSPVKDCKCWPMLGTRWLYRVHLLWHRASIYNVYLRGPVTHTYWRAFGSGAVTTCIYDLGISQLEFEHPTLRNIYVDRELEIHVVLTWMIPKELRYE